jgi:hypothetical protein
MGVGGEPPPDLLTSGFRVAFIPGILLFLAVAGMSALAKDARPGASEGGAVII